jgi:hypothetical protein
MQTFADKRIWVFGRLRVHLKGAIVEAKMHKSALGVVVAPRAVHVDLQALNVVPDDPEFLFGIGVLGPHNPKLATLPLLPVPLRQIAREDSFRG